MSKNCPDRWHWRRRRSLQWLIGQAYVLGIISGSGSVNLYCPECDTRHEWLIESVNWRGKRPYILGWYRRERFWHYWPKVHK